MPVDVTAADTDLHHTGAQRHREGVTDLTAIAARRHGLFTRFVHAAHHLVADHVHLAVHMTHVDTHALLTVATVALAARTAH